jgi:hypothetical protein
MMNSLRLFKHVIWQHGYLSSDSPSKSEQKSNLKFNYYKNQNWEYFTRMEQHFATAGTYSDNGTRTSRSRIIKPCQVLHSQCSLRENTKIWKILVSKNNTIKANFSLIFLFTICHCHSGLAFLSKNHYITSQKCMYFKKENSQNLRQKPKGALWVRHQMSYFVTF